MRLVAEKKEEKKGPLPKPSRSCPTLLPRGMYPISSDMKSFTENRRQTQSRKAQSRKAQRHSRTSQERGKSFFRHVLELAALSYVVSPWNEDEVVARAPGDHFGVHQIKRSPTRWAEPGPFCPTGSLNCPDWIHPDRRRPFLTFFGVIFCCYSPHPHPLRGTSSLPFPFPGH